MLQQKIAILGGGESGVGAALLAKKEGYKVFVSDAGRIKDDYKNVLIQHEIQWEESQHNEAVILHSDVVVKSPGIPDGIPIIKALNEKAVPVISEIEFGFRFTHATIIGVTGSNGKTTTASLVHHILKQELNVGLAGNIGDSFAKQVANHSSDYYVLEVSSFQLDGIVFFKPHIAVITNITPDHLDRYDHSFEKYIDSKFSILKNQTKADMLIYDADDDVINNYINTHAIQSTLIPFSITKELDFGASLNKKNEIQIILKHSTFTMPTQNLALSGKHNIKNAMAAATIASLLKIRKQTIRDSLENFQGVEHRLEHVLKINKVNYINDSKATNVNATYYALESMDAPTVWIVGGQDKGNNYDPLYPFVNEKVKAIICLGVDNEKLLNAFGNMVDIIIETQYMNEAVKIAYKIADAGDNVLLSPANASFDLFQNYEDRGRQFKEAVRNL